MDLFRSYKDTDMEDDGELHTSSTLASTSPDNKASPNSLLARPLLTTRLLQPHIWPAVAPIVGPSHQTFYGRNHLDEAPHKRSLALLPLGRIPDPLESAQKWDRGNGSLGFWRCSIVGGLILSFLHMYWICILGNKQPNWNMCISTLANQTRGYKLLIVHIKIVMRIFISGHISWHPYQHMA